MNQRVVPLPNGDFEVLNKDGTVQGMPQKSYAPPKTISSRKP